MFGKDLYLQMHKHIYLLFNSTLVYTLQVRTSLCNWRHLSGRIQFSSTQWENCEWEKRKTLMRYPASMMLGVWCSISLTFCLIWSALCNLIQFSSNIFSYSLWGRVETLLQCTSNCPSMCLVQYSWKPQASRGHVRDCEKPRKAKVLHELKDHSTLPLGQKCERPPHTTWFKLWKVNYKSHMETIK